VTPGARPQGTAASTSAAKRATADTFFCDTSVLVAAADLRHVHHAPSAALAQRATRATAFCSAHTIAEVHATLTSAGYRERFRSADVTDVIAQIRANFTAISLSVAEYYAAVQDALARGAVSGQVYDVLHLRAAEQSEAETIYTWNIKHFRALASAGLAGRIREPAAEP
jgi:predicted nucleic acid-binding protein